MNKKLKESLDPIIGKARASRFTNHSFRHMNITENIRNYGMEYSGANAGHKSTKTT